MLDYLVLYQSESGNTKKIAHLSSRAFPAIQRSDRCIDTR